jgi:hypothetical protein
MKLFIKNMVCPRCILVIEWELNELNVPTKPIDLGMLEFKLIA